MKKNKDDIASLKKEELQKQLKRRNATVERLKREIKIEAALEKVRARTMAMRRSEELADVAEILFKQVRELGFQPWSAGFNIWLEGDESYIDWVTNPSGGFMKPYTVDLSTHPFFRAVSDAKKRGDDFQVFEISGKPLEETYALLVSFAPEQFGGTLASGITRPTRYINHYVYSEQVGLMFITTDPVPEAHDIFKRFGKVFEQTYTRFLDLQKAEEQARESQIQLAMERVRAKTMAMQHSNELQETALLLLHQVLALGVSQLGCSFNIWDEDRKAFTSWMGGGLGENTLVPPFKVPTSEDIFLFIYEAAQRGESLFVREQAGDELEMHYRYMFSMPAWKQIIGDFTPPTFQVMHCAFFSQGFLMFISTEPIPEAHDIFKRFAKVFEQTYTRFLDLQKSEAQAREAKIEAALERVRSRSIAMRKSEELADIAGKIFSELRQLDLTLNRVLIWTFNDIEKYTTWWSSNPEVESTAESYRIDYNENPAFINYLLAWQQRKPIHLYFLAGDIKKSWSDFLFEHTELSRLPAAVIKNMREEGDIFTISVISDYGLMMVGSLEPLPDVNIDIIQRFGRVFQQSYTRYLDVQKAEAQAREAQIETALEKVRSRSLAMHNSLELNDVVTILFEKLKELQIPVTAAGISIYINGSKNMDCYVCGENRDGLVVNTYQLPYFNNKICEDFYHSYEEQVEYFVGHYSKKEKNNFYEFVLQQTELKFLPDDVKSLIMESESYTISMFPVKHAVFNINDFEGNVLSEGQIKILKRFAKVFEQTYTRFLDLQKAEAQAREAQIEAALERVRSRSMGMQKSEELKEVIQIVFEQFVHLNIHIEHTGFVMDYKTRDDYNIWVADPHHVPSQVIVPYFDSVYYNRFNEAKEKGEDFFATSLGFDEKNRFYQKLFEYIPGLPEEAKEFYFSCPGIAISTVLLDNVCLYIENFSGIPYSEEDNAILMRFGKVFQQTYTRFLDLQKAETQAREARIEVALERTRTQSMLMQHSNELDYTLRVFHEQVLLLGIPSAFSFLWLPDEDNDRHIFWAAWAENTPADLLSKNVPGVFKSKAINYPLDRNEPATAQCLIDWKGKDPVVSYQVPPTGVESYFAAWQELIAGVEHLKPELFSDGLFYTEAFMKYGCFGVMIINELPQEEKIILGRFAIEFERAYTRFLDLQKAEAQAREAQVEAALERVRARTMAMQRSDELSEAATLLFQQVKTFGVTSWSFGFNIWEPDDISIISWMANPDGTFDVPRGLRLPHTEHPHFLESYKARKRGEDFFVIEVGGIELEDTYRYMFSIPAWKKVFGNWEDSGFPVPAFQISHYAFFPQGYLLFITYEPVPDMHDIFKRFAKVFEQTYTRFLDLKKAEAQARESQIEAALERVRSRTMAMQHSEELMEAANLLFLQVQSLGIPVWTCGYNIWEKGEDVCTGWMSTNGSIQPSFRIPLTQHRTFIHMNESRLKGESFHVEEVSGEELADHYRYMFSLPDFKEIATKQLLEGFPLPQSQVNHVFNFKHGNLIFISAKAIPEAMDIFKRFTAVFEQTYTRFLDLQKAEAQAQEAIKRASVDRVRAEIASMRTTSDLERITPLIWNELTTLGVPFIRCGVFIMDEEQEQVQSFLSTPDGKAIAAFRQPYSSHGETARIIEHWQQKKMYKQHWNEAQFIEFTQNLLLQGAVTSGEKYLTENRPTELYLHFLPFLQGMLYAGSPTALSDDELQLVQNLADAFSTAYARYEDFTKLESANIKIEKTLVDLKKTQAQLVQSEKMASLGELTAGIAHEIQNPLNFVNNFSEVNAELLEELKSEKLKVKSERDEKLEDQLLQDIAENERKIIHHGKRADAIVKGMLQHSRISGSAKELTNVNVLADEYLRLAYHGLRAKDKSFNVTLKTDFDETIGNINIIPQDIGRVVLNVITNAFYATNEKQKQNNVNYGPVVSLRTKKTGDAIEIAVADNGTGIPKKAIDKIFQPFFTTKPTGQGTGLGLSLAYDIVKAHGGELRVETKEGDGSEFLILLPLV